MLGSTANGDIGDFMSESAAFCAHCGSANPDPEAKFCWQCGSVLGSQPNVPASSPVVPSGLGDDHVSPQSDLGCDAAIDELSDRTQAAPQDATAPRYTRLKDRFGRASGRTKALVAGGTISVVVIAVVLVISATQHRASTADTTKDSARAFALLARDPGGPFGGYVADWLRACADVKSMTKCASSPSLDRLCATLTDAATLTGYLGLLKPSGRNPEAMLEAVCSRTLGMNTAGFRATHFSFRQFTLSSVQTCSESELPAATKSCTVVGDGQFVVTDTDGRYSLELTRPHFILYAQQQVTTGEPDHAEVDAGFHRLLMAFGQSDPSGSTGSSSTPAPPVGPDTPATPSTTPIPAANPTEIILGKQGTVTGNSGQNYPVVVWARDRITNCAQHAYGTAMIAFLQAHPCRNAHRLLATVSVNGRKVAISVITVLFASGTAADPYGLHASTQFEALEKASGTGAVNDLLREGKRIPGVAPSIPSTEAFTVTAQDAGSAIFDAWWVTGATRDQDAALVAAENDLFLTQMTSYG